MNLKMKLESLELPEIEDVDLLDGDLPEVGFCSACNGTSCSPDMGPLEKSL
ncbi:hypothetical protein ACWE42_20650 [Sutcliffiella cohnii]|uniref:hypothetical protein n=1 Tax=Sutcliffiella horikoshii TaxID=79883 RepID=UPI001CBAF195|nr:hypothetical protein [Sutcliffiella horikoshii]UAL49796.1 hypothetical protein K7887_22790 [Sutcliffiella horikoshii]